MSYKKLRKQYTPEELAEAFVFPVKLTAKQKKEAAVQLAEARKKSQQAMTEETKLASHLWHLRFTMEEYLGSKNFNPDFSFGNCLKKYVDLFDKKRKAFAEDISIDETLLSQLINMHRLPPDYIAIRLELHSDNIIPATLWIRLVEKQRLHEISTDKELRRKEKPFVHSNLITRLSA
jgi:plasmid maintenance system antidote protein VapI